MPDLGKSSALRQLTDLGHLPGPPDWVWAVARLEPSGRLLLPVEARDTPERSGRPATAAGVSFARSPSYVLTASFAST